MPAQILAAMVSGSMVHFIVTESVNSPISIPGPLLRLRRRRAFARNPLSLWVVIGALLLAVVFFLVFLKPLSYGTPGLSPAQVNRRKLLRTW